MIISIIKYSSFIALSALIIFLFFTTDNYYQLAFAIALFIPTVYLGMTLFPRIKIITETDEPTDQNNTHSMLEPDPDKVEINDINKRAFLKIIGAAGLSYFVFSLFGRKTDLFMNPNQNQQPGEATTIGDTTGKKIDPAERQPMDGFRICEIDDDVVSYYGYTNKDGAWIIMREDTENNSFRYIRGETSFRENWDKRELLVYDYYHNVF